MSRAKPAAARLGKAGTTARGSLQAVPPAVFNRPAPPSYLGEEGTARWDALWDHCGPAGAYHPVLDYDTVGRWCSLAERRVSLLGLLQNDEVLDPETGRPIAGGWISTGSMGQAVVHPAVKLLNDVEAKMTPLEDRLGLSPQARNTVEVPVGEAAPKGLAAWLAAQESTG